MYCYRYHQGRYEIFYKNSQIAYIDPKTLALRDVRFEEGKEKIFHVHQILWTMNSNEVYPCKWDVDTAEFIWEQQENGLTLILSALNKDKTLKCTSKVNFFEPNSDNRLSYVVQTQLEVLEEYTFEGYMRKIGDKLYGVIEYTDPYPMHAVGAAVNDSFYWSGIYLQGQEGHTDNWRKRYRKLIFGNKGNYTGYTLNHFINVSYVSLQYGSIVGFFDDPLGALVFTALETNQESNTFNLCSWGYDMHFDFIYPDITDINGNRGYLHLHKGQVFSVSYKMELLSPEKAKEIEQETNYPALTEKQIEILNRPVVTNGINRFNHKCEEDDLFSFAWDYSDNVIWRKDTGYDDNFCLELDGTEKPAHIFLKYGSENFSMTLKENTRYRCYAMIKKLDKDVRVDMQFSFDVPVYKDYHSDPREANIYRKSFVCNSDDYEMFELTGISPSEHALVAPIKIVISNGRALLDNFYFGECS